MRKLWILSVPVLVLSLTGCGGNQSDNRPVEPASLTPGQVDASLKEQKEVDAVEKARLVSLPKVEHEHFEAEESERERHQQRKKSAR
jgi:hypothetical protein